jgi:uncharacterized protein (DUF305 family)
MQKNTVLIAVTALLIGIGGTYTVIAGAPRSQQTTSSHVMTNGQTMDGPMMQGEMDSMMAVLDGKTGDDFDKAFLTEMTVHHQGAVQMAWLALQNARHQEIRDMAQKIITAQQAEIGQMTDWQTAWYGSAQ